MNHTEMILQEWQLLDIAIQKHSIPVLLTGSTLTISQIVSIARYAIDTTISTSAIQSLEASLGTLENKLQNGEVIYGVNTGFGGTADVRTNKTLELQRVLIRELHYGILPPGNRDHHVAAFEECVKQHGYDSFLENCNESTHLPWSWVRAAILIRINSLVKGCSGVRPVIVSRMQDLLKHDIIPMIPLRGSISASGDLSPLSYIGGAIQGKPTIRILSRDQQVYADKAFRTASLEPVVLHAKEGLAIVNGTAISAAVGALALHDTHGLAILSQIITAMSVEALTGTPESFHSFFSEMRPHPGQIESARNILAFLKGSKLTKIKNDIEGSLRQDRYSIRTVPQWIGPVLEDLVLAHQQISIECNSATDNPLLNLEGEFLHGGNFQAKAVTSAMEKTRQGIQSIGRMLFTQCTEIINPATSRGLPPNLVAEDPSISFIFKGTDLNVAALLSELGFLANPINHVQTAEMGNQALNSLALISARYTHTANEVLSQLMASHLVALCQALDLRAMHIQFVDMFQPQLFALILEHYTGFPAVEELSKLLWSQLLKALDTTVSMNSDERFVTIAKSLRSTLLDLPSRGTSANFLTQLDNFNSALIGSLEDAWCANRDAYLVHGDATSLLGKASKVIYTFIRYTLRVPFLSTKVLMTPEPEHFDSKGSLNARDQAATVGSYNGVVYRALRDGTLAKVGVDILRSIYE